MPVPASVGRKMRDRRIELGLRQQDLAEKIGMSRGYVSIVEGGVPWMPSPEVVRAWDEALSWQPGTLNSMLTEEVTGEPDLADFIRAQAREAVRTELTNALQDAHGPLREWLETTVSHQMVDAMVEAIGTARGYDYERVRREGFVHLNPLDGPSRSKPRRRERELGRGTV